MISNSFSTKPKTSKSSDELEVTEASDSEYKVREQINKSPSGDYIEDNSSGGATSLSTIVICDREKPDLRPKSRTRSKDDFQMARGPAVRRGSNLRSRSTNNTSKKLDRENDTYYSSRGKFQESLNKGNTSDGPFSSKTFSEGERSKNKFDVSYMVPEDCRISKLLRRLCREDDAEKSVALCKQLQESFMVPENGRYIRRSLDMIVESLLDMLHSAPSSTSKNHASLCLGRVGYVLEQDFKRFMDWIFTKMSEERNDNVRMLLMKALLETLRLESEEPKLKDHSAALMSELQSVLEHLHHHEMLICTVDVIITLTEIYPDTLNDHFRDTVDILVGWHIDSHQSQAVVRYASNSLLRFGRYWGEDMEFSVNLLSQFVEDMELLTDDLDAADQTLDGDHPPTPEESAVRLTLLIRVFSTVLRCIFPYLESTDLTPMTWVNFVDYFVRILTTVKNILEAFVLENLIVAANDCSRLLLFILQQRTTYDISHLIIFVDYQLELIQELTIETVVSVLQLICRMICDVSAALPIEFIDKLLGPVSPILRLRFFEHTLLQKELIAIYHSLLSLKNIPLLQESYRYMLGDLEMAYKLVLPDVELCNNNPLNSLCYKIEQVERVTLFYCRAFADLANTNNSIISMWALKPSILELFAAKLKPHSKELSNFSPAMQYNHFVLSSELVNTQLGILGSTGPDVSSSPTSGHFAVVLKLLAELVLHETTLDVMCLTLRWIQEVFIHSLPYLKVLYQTEEYQVLLNGLVKAGYTRSTEIVSGILDNLEQLFKVKETSFQRVLCSNVVELCFNHLNSTNIEIKQKVLSLLMYVPWHITMAHLSKLCFKEFKKKPFHEAIVYNKEAILAAKRYHLSHGICGEMQPQHFRKFMGYLLQGLHYSESNWIVDLFHSCWPLQLSQCSEEEEVCVGLFGKLASSSTSLLYFWSTWEAAQLCIMYKLRTPLGKPQETFTSIEGAIKSLAREITQSTGGQEDLSSRLKNLNVSFEREESPPLIPSPTLEDHEGVCEQHRVRLLLEFVEQLEKVIHNAAEGCASAMVPPPKPVRTFFHTNKSTCLEWLTRIRIAVVVVAIHAGQAATAVRHGFCLLQDLSDTANTQGPEFERAAMYVCWALCKLREPEAILGIYTWCKEISGRKFPWLKVAAEQAMSRFETAAESYCKLITSLSPLREHAVLNLTVEDVPSMVTKGNSKHETEPYVLGFMADQIVDCYKAVNNWADLLQWKEKEKDFWANQNGGTVYKYILNSVSASQAKALVQFDEVDPVIMDSLSKWPSVEIPSISLSDHDIIGGGSWSGYKLMSDVNNTVMNIAMSVSKDINPSTDKKLSYLKKIKECIYVTQNHIEEGLRNMPSEFLMEATIINYAASGLQDVLLDKPYRPVFTFTENCSTLKFATSSMLCQVLWWAKYFRHTCSPEEHIATSSAVKNLQLEVARMARKEGNLGLAQRMLIDLLNQEGILFGSHNELEDVARALSRTVEEIYLGVHKVRYVTEVAKLLYSMDKLESAVQLSTVTTLKLLSHIDSTEHPVKERCSRLLLTLAKWIQQSNRISEGAKGPLDKLLSWKSGINILPDIKYDSGRNGTHIIPVGDMMVGQLLQCGVASCPALGKSWNQLAAWCYRWGRRVVDAAVETGGQLSDADKLAVRKLLPAFTSQESLEQIYSVLSKTKDIVDEEDIEAEDFNTSEMIESQLRNIDALSTASKEDLMKLVDIWCGAQKRVYSYYELSATAYFKYLEICGNTESLVETGDCLTITATLRLLRLIVKHALELQSVLETGLTTTPTGPWKGIIPQLFSRLSHPEPYVRRRVSELLCRVAEDAPHLITFPAVVGAAAGGAQLRNMSLNTSTSRLFGACLSQQSSDAGELMDVVEEDDEEEENEEDDDEGCSDEENVQASVLKTCFRAMVDILSKQAPEAISQVQLLVKELRRITLLWDELWLGTLVQHHTEILRRMAQLEAEIAKVEDNTSLSSTEKEFLISEKHRIILKPLVFVLEQLHAITSVNPETPHEKWFQEKFGSSINEALEKLKYPTNPRRPHDSWQLLKQLQSRLQQRAQKRSAYSVRMSDVSPALAELKNTPIAMPGIASCGGKIITIASVENSIAILPTKTKPKKLVFHGSNGQMYTYLFKGLEDLHLDERIMQFLHIANTMMSHGNDRNALYRARHYSVIPLGPRSGLISWVDGVTPLFGLYKRWQQREAASALLKTQPHAQAFSGPAPVLRPSELFYNKLTPLLKERGVSNLDNRKEWPLSILRQVLTELMDETPKDLLAKELWCHSVSAGAWWHTVRTYSYSVAVMSIIGYIIGLGDRHLDNVLVDLSTGEVVHIDYNVCFEKGKTLRVPEKVPFRMTPNIRAALGVTGVEGIFRHACEHVLKVMKKGRETLLTLLEAFVYDPLVDWTPGNETGYTGAVYGGGQAITTETKQSKKELEREVTQAMFCVRVAEMKSDWFENRKELEASLPIVVDHLNQWLDVYATIKGAKSSLEDCHHQMALVKEAEASPQHPLYTLFTRYAKFHCAKDALESAKVRLKEKIEECKNELALHQLALVSVCGPQLSQWMNELNNTHVDKDSHMVFDLVKEFLQNAGQAQMIIQCEQSENDLGQMAQQQNILIRSCLDLLGQYVAVASLYPASYMSGHRSICYRRWAQDLFDDFTVENCQKVALSCKAAFGSEAPEGQRGHVLAVSYQLQGVLTQVDTNIQKCFEKMTAESFHDGNEKCEEARLVIDKFLRSERGAKLAFECVNITALCSLNQRYLKMEAAASSAGDCLVDLTSRDGGWFLDEMFLTSALVIELANLIPHVQDYETLELHSPENNKKVELVLTCLHSSHKIFKGLLELNFNFHTIILPEAIKNIAMEEPTVLGMMQELDDIISEAGCPLPELLPQLEMHLRFVIMEMESPQKSCCATVARLRSQFNALLQKSSGNTIEDTLTPGQMLLMGFNGLFEKLLLDGNALVTALQTLDTPICWKQVDQVREAKSYSAPVFKDATRAVLEDIALVKRLITMQEFFLLCGQTARGLAIFSDDHLNRPVRRFTADYVSRQLLGVISQTLALALCLLLERIGLNVTVEVEQHEVGLESKVPLKDLCHKTVDRCMKNGLFSTSTLAQASSFCHKLEIAFRRREMSKHLQQEIEIHRSSLQRLQLQLTAHHWLHEDILISQATPVASLSRPNFLLELRKTSMALLSMQQRIVEMRDQQSALVTSVEQRLKWAAGANPALGEIMTAFETAVENRKRQLDVEQHLATMVANTCNALLHHEALRTNTTEALAYDAAFLEIIGQCEKSCRLAFGCDKLVTPEEESLVNMLMPQGPVDGNWISNVETLISDKIKSLQQQIEKQQESLAVAQDNIKSQTIVIRGLLSTHYKLAADVRTLLKSMAKSEESGFKDLQEYLASYKVYSEKFSALVRDLLSEDLDSDKLNKCLEHIVELGSSTKMIYEDILEFSKQNAERHYNTSHEDSNIQLKRPPLTRQDSVCFSPRKGLPVPASIQKTSRDPYTGKAVQERNAYALGVWRRVRMKLEGRDPDPGRRLTVQEQVDYVIREAMSLDNLALLYEGWTPWV